MCYNPPTWMDKAKLPKFESLQELDAGSWTPYWHEVLHTRGVFCASTENLRMRTLLIKLRTSYKKTSMSRKAKYYVYYRRKSSISKIAERKQHLTQF